MSNYPPIYLNIFLYELEFNAVEASFKLLMGVHPIWIGNIIITTIAILLFLNVLEDLAAFPLEIRKEENK